MSTAIDLTGRVFGRLTVLERAGKSGRGRSVLWVCSCTCTPGRTKTVASRELRNGDTKSCGCLRGQIARDRTKAEQPKAETEPKAMTPKAETPRPKAETPRPEAVTPEKRISPVRLMGRADAVPPTMARPVPPGTVHRAVERMLRQYGRY